MPVYTNAADVLPPDLLAEVQKRWQGLLYVPPAKKENELTEKKTLFFWQYNQDAKPKMSL